MTVLPAGREVQHTGLKTAMTSRCSLPAELGVQHDSMRAHEGRQQASTAVARHQSSREVHAAGKTNAREVGG